MPSPSQLSQRPPFTLKLKRPGLYPRILDSGSWLKRSRMGANRPRAGRHGGEVVAVGSPGKIARSKKSLTGKYLTGKLHIPVPDVYVQCEVCKGQRYNRETMQVKYKGKSIADVLDMTVNQALDFMTNIPAVKRRLQTLSDVGLGYIHLGQAATTLSGGEAQRVKLATELSKIGTGNTLYILDEPTTGLHFEDINMLLGVLNRLVDKGNTVIVIEHNLDVIKTADHIIDIGPDGGERGGTIIAQGSPEKVAKDTKSYTGQFLVKELEVKSG